MNAQTVKHNESIVSDLELFNHLMTISSLSKSLARRIVYQSSKQRTRMSKNPKKDYGKEVKGCGCF